MGFLSKIKEHMNKKAPAKSADRKVFAHYMVGITFGQALDVWVHDINTAKQAGIDGFALNIGPSDTHTNEQLQQAYQAAEQAGDFVLFLSFDMACGEWEVNQVADLINHYSNSSAQMVVDGKPFVSTFEGPAWAENWNAVREQTGGIFLVPDWSSIGPYGVGEKLDIIDGAFSWDAWPKAGQTKMTADEDRAYKHALRGKKYMMGVSPYFYTNLPQWNKNWYSSSESLWHDRWQQVMEIMPDYVQIITWNDFGESSYICDTIPEQIVPGAHKYVNKYPHSALRAVLPYLITAYKAGSPNIDHPGDDVAIAWYRTTSIHAGHDGDTKWGQCGSGSAAHGARDVISVMVVSRGPGAVVVTIGDQKYTFNIYGSTPLSYFEIPFDCNSTGPVTLSLNGKTTWGPEITNSCESHVCFNSVAIQV
ncbi:glycoside hydrolase [Apodospora peruviana]|uniref:Glycoside hydrolase n=1 Tax=Apodospora peruviana TaxID=516989 RepID=A0AAE0M3K1_9PEZI|nr:glycoside hydrolase [Apodospora peruviana]